MTLAPDEAKTLLRSPMGGQWPMYQLIATASGAHLVATEPSDRRTPSTLSISSESPENRRRAQKYVRLALAAKQGWTDVDEDADCDRDLTVLKCPQDIRHAILGRNGANLYKLAEAAGVVGLAADEGLPALPPKAPETWLEVGCLVEVKRRGDFREKGKWVA